MFGLIVNEAPRGQQRCTTHGPMTVFNLSVTFICFRQIICDQVKKKKSVWQTRAQAEKSFSKELNVCHDKHKTICCTPMNRRQD